MDSRKRMGKDKDGVIFPVAPNLSEMSDSYLDFIEAIKKEIENQRLKVVLNANSSMICLYWNIGKAILQKQEEEGWGAKVIDRMAKDLKDAFPDMSGFSPRNIKYMRKFAECWPDFEIVQRVVAQIPWRTNRMLLDKLDTQEERIWYAHKTIENGWSSTILDLQIQSKLIERTGKSVNNFPVALPPADSDMANQIFKDPYLFDFLGTDMPRREVEIERKLTEHIQNFLLELGQGFAFVGRQVHLEVGGDDFYIDLLFYHLKLRCYVVIELKAWLMNNELMRDENFIRCSTMIAELLMKYKSMETEEDQEGWMQEGASSPLLFLLRLLKSFLSSFILFEVDVYY